MSKLIGAPAKTLESSITFNTLHKYAYISKHLKTASNQVKAMKFKTFLRAFNNQNDILLYFMWTIVPIQWIHHITHRGSSITHLSCVFAELIWPNQCTNNTQDRITNWAYIKLWLKTKYFLIQKIESTN